MTEKRFTLSEVFLLDKPCISDNGNDLRQEDVVDLLNTLHEENQTLKQAYNDAKSDVERYEQILKDIMNDNLLIQDAKKELKC